MMVVSEAIQFWFSIKLKNTKASSIQLLLLLSVIISPWCILSLGQQSTTLFWQLFYETNSFSVFCIYNPTHKHIHLLRMYHSTVEHLCIAKNQLSKDYLTTWIIHSWQTYHARMLQTGN